MIARRNPVAKLAAAAIIMLGLIGSLDVVSGAVAVLLELPLLFLAGLGFGRFWRRTWIVWLAAPLTAITIALYGRPSGVVHFEWFVVRISDGSLELAAATALRVLAIALPAVVLFATIDPTNLADGLSQILRLPARFVLGALAALRLVGLLDDDRRMLELARRARGVGDRRGIRRLAGLAFALFVLAIRRGSLLATAMEARGFGGPGPRTWARPSRLTAADRVFVAASAIIPAVAIAAAVAAGTWRFLFA